MANYCDNRIEVTSTDEKKGFAQMKELVKLLFKTDDPEKIREYSYKDWEKLDLLSALPREHDDIYEDYGTKWLTLSTVDYDDDKEYPRLEIFCDTAWGPPNVWIKRLGEKFPDLRFVCKYEEDGNAFLGVCVAMGHEFTDESINY